MQYIIFTSRNHQFQQHQYPPLDIDLLGCEIGNSKLISNYIRRLLLILKNINTRIYILWE